MNPSASDLIGEGFHTALIGFHHFAMMMERFKKEKSWLKDKWKTYQGPLGGNWDEKN